MTERKGDLRQAFVKVPLTVMAAELFGPGVIIDRVVITNDDLLAGTVTAIVSGHESLPIIAPGDNLGLVVPDVTHYANGLRSTEFRAFEPIRN